MHAKSSLISKLSFGIAVPNFAAEIMKSFAQTHEETLNAIHNVIGLMREAISLLLACDAHARNIANVKEGLLLDVQDDSSRDRGFFERMSATLSKAVGRDLVPTYFEDNELRILEDTGHLLNGAHGDIIRVSSILNAAHFKLEEIRKCALTCFAAPDDVTLSLAPRRSQERDEREGGEWPAARGKYYVVGG